MAAISASWIEIPQPRLSPSGSGGGKRSISGDHTNLNAYGVPTKANAPIAARRTPAVASQAESVEKVSSRGRPLENPNTRTSNTRRSPYTAIERRQLVMSSWPLTLPIIECCVRLAAPGIVQKAERVTPHILSRTRTIRTTLSATASACFKRKRSCDAPVTPRGHRLCNGGAGACQALRGSFHASQRAVTQHTSFAVPG
jgi:hypothetical protein